MLLGVCCRFWEELLEVLEKIGSSIEQLRYLSINVLNGF